MRHNRRRFLKSLLLSTSSVAVPWVTGRQVLGANNRFRVGAVGLRGRGFALARNAQAVPDTKVVALCDVDRQILGGRAEELAKRYGYHAETFEDLRRMLDRNDIDAITVGTPNHWHALATILAAQAGKHVYVEKPVSYSFWEGQQMTNAARRYHRVIQAGTQRRSQPFLREAAEWFRDRPLGKVLYAVGSLRKGRSSIGKRSQPLDIPDHVNYDLWCGPAPKVELYRPRLHYQWHWDFTTGNGELGNTGVHHIDVLRWFLGKDELPRAVFSVGGRFGYDDAAETPNTQAVWYDYGDFPLVYELRGLPRSEKFLTPEVNGSFKAPLEWARNMDPSLGNYVQCEEGRIDLLAGRALDNDGNLVRQFERHPDRLHAQKAHMENFIMAARQGDPSRLNGEIIEGHLSSALCHLGNISHRLGRKTEVQEIREAIPASGRFPEVFDSMIDHLQRNGVDLSNAVITRGARLELASDAGKFVHNKEADALLRRHDREPFEIPEVPAAALS